MTSPRPEPFRPVDVRGSLRLETPGGRSLNFAADGGSIRLDLPQWNEARTLLPRSFLGRRGFVRSLANMLDTHGLTLSLESAGTAVLRVGHNVSPSWPARLLGLAPAYIPVSAIRLLFRR